MMKQRFVILFLIPFLACRAGSVAVKIVDNFNKPSTQFGVLELNKACSKAGIKSNNHTYNKVIVITSNGDVPAQGYHIQAGTNDTIAIIAGGPVGAMYGLFDLAEQLSMNASLDAVQPKTERAYLQKRGIKFNIPLDARTPSYDDTGDAAQKNIAQMWEWDFWKQFIDQMALNRYNVLSLWNPHPFPSMLKLDLYPDVALDNVCVTTLKPVGKENEWAEPQMVSRNVLENLKVVKTMSIAQKTAFWQRVMQYANDLGIDIYYITWNVCPNAAANAVEPYYRTYMQPVWAEKPGKYGITNQMDNPKTVAYLRESVKQFLLTFPLVKGIGVTAGEHMMDTAGMYTREQWIWETYGQGILDAKKIDPQRHVNFIHRVWNADMNRIMKYWKAYPDTFEVSFKYAKARLYSTPDLHFADEHIKQMKGYNLKSWWNLRNDDIFVYRWGDPDYVRAFIANFRRDCTAGFYMGSDGYVWGREFTSKHPELSGQPEVNKHWFNFMLWGRLAYNNTLNNDFFIHKLNTHFPQVNGGELFNAWQCASKIVPKVNCFHWQDWDYQWSVEVCLDERTGFNTVLQFMDNPTLAGSNMLNPSSYARSLANGSVQNKITPWQVADSLNIFADKALAMVPALKHKRNSAELANLIDDIEAQAYLGKYYAVKIEAATELALLKASKDEQHREKAVLKLKKGIEFWTKYTEISEQNYKPQMLARTKELDWRMWLEAVKNDVAMAQNMRVE